MTVSPSHIQPAHPTTQAPRTQHHQRHHHHHHGQNAPGRAPAIRRTRRRNTWLSLIIERWPRFTNFLRGSHIQSRTIPWSLPSGNSRMHHHRRHHHHQNQIVYLCFMPRLPNSNGPCLQHQRPPQRRLPYPRPRWTLAVHKHRPGWLSKLSINYQPVQ
jgi:hypothetical protein